MESFTPIIHIYHPPEAPHPENEPPPKLPPPPSPSESPPPKNPPPDPESSDAATAASIKTMMIMINHNH